MAYKNKLDAQAYSKAYREANKEKEAARIKAWKQANKERISMQSKEYNEANKSDISLKKQAYYLENKERIDARNIAYNKKNRIKLSKKETEWRSENRGNVAANIRRYQVAKMNRTAKWLTKFDKLKISCIYSVAAMLTRENKEAWHVDHIIPLQGRNVSGLHVPSNLQVIRGEENMAKHNKFEVSHA
jgi:hypothetical protein